MPAGRRPAAGLDRGAEAEWLAGRVPGHRQGSSETARDHRGSPGTIPTGGTGRPAPDLPPLIAHGDGKQPREAAGRHRRPAYDRRGR